MVISKPIGLVFTLLALVALNLSSCQTVLPRERVRAAVRSIDALVVVHPTYYYDQEGMAKRSINFITEEFLRQKKKVYTLVGSPSDLKRDHYQNYFSYLKETEIIYSNHGENNIGLKGTRFVVVGGYLEACLKSALLHISKNNAPKEKREITFFLPLPAIYRSDIKLELRDWKLFNLHRYLPEGTNLKVVHQGRTLYEVNKLAKDTITLHFRGYGETPFLDAQNTR